MGIPQSFWLMDVFGTISVGQPAKEGRRPLTELSAEVSNVRIVESG